MCVFLCLLESISLFNCHNGKHQVKHQLLCSSGCGHLRTKRTPKGIKVEVRWRTPTSAPLSKEVQDRKEHPHPHQAIQEV